MLFMDTSIRSRLANAINCLGKASKRLADIRISRRALRLQTVFGSELKKLYDADKNSNFRK